MSDPTFTKFNPRNIPWQWEATKYIRDFDYSKGVLEVFYSGGVGSAKTIDHVHELVKSCLDHPGSKWLMIRRALKDLKRTSWSTMINHLSDMPGLIKQHNKTELRVDLVNGSTIMGDSYDNGDKTKFQSLALSGLDIEEANEIDEDMYTAIKLRLGRAGVKVNRIQARCNPDSPSHWLHKYFIEDKDHPFKKVFYSLTEQNPYLPPWYIENLKRDLDPKMARRMLYGEWLEINNDRVYYAYKAENNLLKSDYEIDKRYPICLCFDFNIGLNKPLSSCAYQYVNGVFHVFDEVIIHGARTSESLESWFDKGIFNHGCKIIVHGDSTGAARNTRSIHSDYDIIKKFISNITPHYEMQVPRDNPPVRTRHNRVNAHCLNEAGQVRLYVYNKAKTVHDGMRLTALKKGGDYVEDDSKPYQHVTTALGYGIVYDTNRVGMQGSSSERIR